jgi:hypothetical protein
MLHVIGLLVLSLLITTLIVFAVLILASGFAYWLATSPSTIAIQLRKLSNQPSNQPLENTNQDATTNPSNEEREEGKPKHKRLVHRIYSAKGIQKPHPLLEARELGVNNFASIRENMCTDSKENNGTQHPKANLEGFNPTGTFQRLYRYVSSSTPRHIRTIVNKLRRRVNQSGKEPVHAKT